MVQLQNSLSLVSDRKHTSKLSTGCPIIDEFLRGGISTHGLTEICGEASSGKTQFLLRLMITAQFPLHKGGLQGAGLYIATEGRFCSERLRQITSLIPDARSLKHDPLERVYIYELHNINELYDTIEQKLEKLILLWKIKVVVIDSITAPFRPEFGRSLSECRERTEWLTNLSARMRQLSHTHGIPFVVSNQISSCSIRTKTVHSKPALGLTWSNCINTRLWLRFKEGQSEEQFREAESHGTYRLLMPRKRELSVIFSPTLPNSSCFCIVNGSGVVGVS